MSDINLDGQLLDAVLLETAKKTSEVLQTDNGLFYFDDNLIPHRISNNNTSELKAFTITGKELLDFLEIPVVAGKQSPIVNSESIERIASKFLPLRTHLDRAMSVHAYSDLIDNSIILKCFNINKYNQYVLGPMSHEVYGFGDEFPKDYKGMPKPGEQRPRIKYEGEIKTLTQVGLVYNLRKRSPIVGGNQHYQSIFYEMHISVPLQRLLSDLQIPYPLPKEV